MVEKKIKVLIDALSARQGGGQTYIINLLRYVRVQCKLEILLLAPQSLRVSAGTPITRLPVGRWLENPFVRACWQRWVLPGYLRKYSPDVLFCPGGLIPRGVSDDVKVVTTFQNMLPFDEAATKKYPYGYQRFRIWILRRLMVKGMVRADLVIFISTYARSVVETLLKGQLKKTAIVPHGVAPEFMANLNSSPERPLWLPKEQYFLYVSTYDFYKAQIEVVRGFALYRGESGLEHKLVLVGPENRAYGSRLRKEVSRLGMENAVILAGVIPYAHLPALYHHALVNIFASEVENCPNILMEMMASGRPAVVSSRPPMPEFGGDAVYYFDPARPDQLAEKLKEIVEDQARMEFMGNRALERSRLYDWEHSARLTWEAITSLIR